MGDRRDALGNGSVMQVPYRRAPLHTKPGFLVTFPRLAGLLLAAVLLSMPRAEAVAASAPVHLMILGDSLTAGYGLPAQDGFQARLAAVSGDTTADAAARLDWALGGGEVDAALVELGGNDGLRGLDPALMRHNLTHILDTFQAKHIPVLLSGMIAPPNLGRDYGARFTAVFTALGQRPGILYDPFFLAGLVGHPEYAQADGIHPDRAGVAIEVKRLLPLILQLIGAPQVRDNARADAAAHAGATSG
jgi:acyl-CoA thioesterase-1